MRCGERALLIACLAAGGLACPGGSPPGDPVPSQSGAAEGYVLFAPLLARTAFLVDRDQRVVHAWETGLPASVSVYLTERGHLLRSAKHTGSDRFPSGYGGRLQELDWDGNVVWDWSVPSGKFFQHHDFEPLPGGNVLLIAWEVRSREEALGAGRLPHLVGRAGLWPDCVLEVRPLPPDGGEIVWQWCMWDHLVQNVDPRAPGFGKLSDHPGRIDVNGDRSERRTITEELVARLRAIGYVGGDASVASMRADFLHSNSIDYNPELDQIVLSVPRFHEIWIIDHGTTTEEAAGGSGGRSGRGGDLLYRWGNPAALDRGSASDQRLFAQHDAQWVPPGYPGAGHITIFNNGSERAGRPYSSVVEIETPLDADGGYEIGFAGRRRSERPVWEYTAPKPRSFFAEFISGAHRLANGNTLVTSGPDGRIFEVTPRGDIVWDYLNPYSGDAPNPTGDPPHSIFRATLIPPDHPALAGRDLKPLDPQPPRTR